MTAERARALADLVRLPAVLTVPGDVLTGAAWPPGPRPDRSVAQAAGLCAASAGLYLGGMALNDWADRGVDARERPRRPLPSGRVTPRTALGLAAGLTAAGLAAAGLAGGRRSLTTAAAVAAAAWSYDLGGKSTPAGPALMASARALDVLLGAGADLPAASPAAALVGLHTAVTTSLSRHEAGPPTAPAAAVSPGAAGRAAGRALAGTAAVSLGAGALAVRRAGGRRGRLAVALGLIAAYAGTVGAPQVTAWRHPAPASVRRAVGAGVLGLVLLEAGLLAAAGAALPAAAVASAWPLATFLHRKRSVT